MKETRTAEEGTVAENGGNKDFFCAAGSLSLSLSMQQTPAAESHSSSSSSASTPNNNVDSVNTANKTSQASRKELEEQLNDLLQALFELSVVVYDFQPDGNHLVWNKVLVAKTRACREG